MNNYPDNFVFQGSRAYVFFSTVIKSWLKEKVESECCGAFFVPSIKCSCGVERKC